MAEHNEINLEELIRNMKIVPEDYKKSVALFNECVKQKRFDLIVQFADSLLTEDFIAQNLLNIIKAIHNNVPENLQKNRFLFNKILNYKALSFGNRIDIAKHFDSSLLDEEFFKKYAIDIIENIQESYSISENNFPLAFRNSKTLFAKCVELNRFNIVIYFNSSLLTEDFVAQYLNEIMDCIEAEPPLGLRKSKVLFNEFAKYENRYYYLEFFDGSVITAEFIQNNPHIVDSFLRSSYDIPVSFKNSQELLIECAKRKRSDLLMEFNKDLFTEDFIKDYSDIILSSFKDTIPPEFKNSKVLLAACLKQNNSELLNQFASSLLTEQFFQDHSSLIINSLKGDLPSEFSNSKALLEECVKQERFSLLLQFDKSLFTEEFITRNLNFILSNLTHDLPIQFQSSKVLFYTCFKQENFALLTQFDEEFFTDEFVAHNLEWFMLNITGYLPYRLSSSKVLLNAYCNQKNFNKLLEFDEELFTEDFISNNLDFIMDNLKADNFDPLEGLGPFYSSQTIFFASLKRNKTNLVPLMDTQFHSDSFIQENLELYVNSINEGGTVPHLCTSSPILFNEFLNKKMSNLLVQMHSSLFTYDILKDNYSYLASILKSNTQNSFLLTDIPEFKQLVLNNNDYDLLVLFPFAKYIITEFASGEEPQFNQEQLKLYSNILGISEKELANKIKDLLKINNDILNTIRPFMLSQKMNCLSFKNIEKLSIYPDIQFKLNQSSQKDLMLLNRILTYLDNELDKSYDISTIIYYIINNWECHKDLLATLNSNELTNEQVANLIFILQRKNDFYPVKTAKDLEPDNFNKLTNEVFKDLEERTLSGNITVEELKRAIFEKKYGLDLERAKFINTRYCQDMEIVKNSPNISERNRLILQSINYLLNIDDLAKLSFLYLTTRNLPYNYSSLIDLDAQIREDYAKKYSEYLYKIKEEHRMKKEDFATPSLYAKISKIKYKGKKPQFYVLDGDFNLQIHVLGAYSDFTRPANFKEDWTRPKIAKHGICTSYIGNNQIANARQFHPAYGFASYAAEALLAIQNSDINSINLVSQFASSIFQPCCFYPPKEMIDKTRDSHNELVLERRSDKGSSSFKRLPSYVVYIVDDINNPTNFDMRNNELFSETVQAAVDNDIPIIIVDRLKYAKREKQKYETLLEKFAKQPNPEDLKDILLIVCDNMIGCEKYPIQPDMAYHTYFNEEVLTAVLDKIIAIIEKQPEQVRQYLISELYKINLKEPLIKDKNKVKINRLYYQLHLDDNLLNDNSENLRKVREYYDNAPDEIKKSIALDIDHGLSYEYVYLKIINGEYQNTIKL